MKILLITATLNERSGWGRYSSAIIHELRALGHNVTVLSEDGVKDKSDDVHVLRTLRSRTSLVSFLSNCLQARKLARSAEIVHALEGWPYGVYGFAAVLGTRKKLFLNGVGTYSVAPLYETGSAILLRNAYARAKAVLCISEYTRKQIIAAGVDPQKVFTVHMGAPHLPMVTAQESTDAAQRAGIPEDAYPIILTVGSIKERKGQLDTLKAVEILKREFPRIFYVAAGSGNQKEYIAMMRKYADSNDLKDNLAIINNADDKMIAGLYARCTVFALNSNSDADSHHFEGFGLVVIEAAGYGKPSVGSRDSGVEDAIDDGTTGFLARQHDPSDIAGKIRLTLARYEFFSANAKLWHSRFAWRTTVERYVQAYAENMS